LTGALRRHCAAGVTFGFAAVTRAGMGLAVVGFAAVGFAGGAAATFGFGFAAVGFAAAAAGGVRFAGWRAAPLAGFGRAAFVGTKRVVSG